MIQSEIIKEIEAILKLPLNSKQKRYYQDLLKAAKPVNVVRAIDVLEDYEIDFIRNVIKPQARQCMETPIYFARHFRSASYTVRVK